MKSYITAAIGTVIFLFIEAILAMVLYVALRCVTTIDNSALWIGCCLLAGCLFISLVLEVVIGIFVDSGKQAHETTV